MRWLVSLLLTVAAQAQSCNDACQARKAEAHLLKPGIAERHGDRLVLVTPPGKLVFDDNKKACNDGNAQDCAIYALAARAPGSLAVRKFGFEGSDSWLIDSHTGRKTLLAGVPVFSPDGREFLVTRFSNEGDDNLEIWRRDGDGARLEWAHPFKQVYAEDPSLKNVYDARVIAWRGNRIALALSEGARHWTGSLTRDAKGWHLAARSPQTGTSARP